MGRVKKIVAERTLALAIVSALSVGTSHAYEWQINETTVFEVGGDIELAYKIEDEGAGHERELFDNGSEIDFSGEHALSEQLSAYFKAEFEYAVDEAGEQAFESDDVYFGVKSERYGALQVGDWNGIYDDAIDDLLDVFEVGEAGSSTEDYRTESGDAIAYFSPVFNGFSFAVQGFFKGEDHDPATVDGQAFQATVQYEAGLFDVYAGYDDNGIDDGADGTLGLGASIDLEPLTLAFKFETFGGDSSPADADSDGAYEAQGLQMYGMAVAYDYGNGILQAVVNHIDPEDGSLDSRTAYGVYGNYTIADNFYVYIEHIGLDQNGGKDDYTATGLVYEF